jgi:fused signal recognition particle receptor
MRWNVGFFNIFKKKNKKNEIEENEEIIEKETENLTDNDISDEEDLSEKDEKNFDETENDNSNKIDISEDENSQNKEDDAKDDDIIESLKEEKVDEKQTTTSENLESEINNNENATNERNETTEKKGLFHRLKKGLSKTSNKIVGGMESVFLGKKEIDEELLEELEELLITADMGVATVIKIIDEVRDEVSRKVLKNPQELKTALKNKIFNILNIDNSLIQTEDHPYVVLVIGVNGVGKTTSIAKLANMFKQEGLKTMLAAGDTFRAAAVNQLKIWADRVGVPVVAQKEGSDPAAVIFDAVQSAKAKNYDVLIADTAGRLHTKYNLMNELSKIIRVMKKELPDAPHELLLVLDATAGQNAINQAKQFQAMIGATGIVLTKLDGTAKGGVIVGIVDELNIPVKFIGFGEGMEDLRPFNAKSFVDALFSDEIEEKQNDLN